MMIRALIVLVILGLVVGAASLSYIGYGGESKSVTSTRVGSPGGGYIRSGRVK